MSFVDVFSRLEMGHLDDVKQTTTAAGQTSLQKIQNGFSKRGVIRESKGVIHYIW